MPHLDVLEGTSWPDVHSMSRGDDNNLDLVTMEA